MWSNICLKSTYTVNFDTEKLVEDAVKILNRELHIQDVRFKGKNEAAKSVVKYDLAGKLADMTGLKRKTVIEILSRVESSVFSTVSRKSGRIYRSGRKIDLKCERNSDFGKYHISYVRRKIYKRYFYTADDSGKTGSGRNESREAFV